MGCLDDCICNECKNYEDNGGTCCPDRRLMGVDCEFYINKNKEDEMKNLEGVKVGDKVWSVWAGWDTIESIDSDEVYSITLSNGSNYTMDGKTFCDDESPTLFFDIPEFYKNEIYPERPQYRAEKDSFYYFITIAGCVGSQRESNDIEDDKIFRAGNYFETKEEAMDSKFYKVFHEEDDNANNPSE